MNKWIIVLILGFVAVGIVGFTDYKALIIPENCYASGDYVTIITDDRYSAIDGTINLCLIDTAYTSYGVELNQRIQCNVYGSFSKGEYLPIQTIAYVIPEQGDFIIYDAVWTTGDLIIIDIYSNQVGIDPTTGYKAVDTARININPSCSGGTGCSGEVRSVNYFVGCEDNYIGGGLDAKMRCARERQFEPDCTWQCIELVPDYCLSDQYCTEINGQGYCKSKTTGTTLPSGECTQEYADLGASNCIDCGGTYHEEGWGIIVWKTLFGGERVSSYCDLPILGMSQENFYMITVMLILVGSVIMVIVVWKKIK